MIFWIASYPKSGNTWIRAFLTTYIFSQNDNFNFELLKKIPIFPNKKQIRELVDVNDLKKNILDISKYWIPAQQKLNLDKSIKFFKTHTACVAHDGRWFTDENNSIGYIYVVRDPRSVACSYAKYANTPIDNVVRTMVNPNSFGTNQDDIIADIWSSWKINYLSWKKEKKFKGIIVKYEDLLTDPFNEFKNILLFLRDFYKMDIIEDKIKSCIASCELNRLKKLEEKSGFSESIYGNKFFRKGEKDEWEKVLPVKLKKQIESAFKDEMIELDYL